MTADPNITLCDREPIHIPGAIQPHGLMLVVDPKSLSITHGAGDVTGWLNRDQWLSVRLGDLLGHEVEALAQTALLEISPKSLERVATPCGHFDVRVHRSGAWAIVEIERAIEAQPASPYLVDLEAAAAAFERASNSQELFGVAARAFRHFTGYDRVMIYRFLDDEAGVVVGEDIASGSRSFLNHHFPAADIPRQARALYVRNLVRVIPCVTYTPAPLTPPWNDKEPLDMSDAVLRSVSPIHLQYLQNMGVGASASFSIVKDGLLWGLVACHHERPQLIPSSIRIACRALAAALARQVKSREETDAYRERVRLRAFEDDIVSLLSREGSLATSISNHTSELMKMLGADGVAVRRGRELVTGGHCPSPDAVAKLATWCAETFSERPFATERLADHYPIQPADQRVACGVLAITLSVSEPWSILWFRAEALEVVQWAGNPHQKVDSDQVGQLTPRSSFDAWAETVRGRARRWTLPEMEAAGRLQSAVLGVWQNRRIRDLNRDLMKTLDDKDLLIKQKDFLVGEVNHRVQNSLQLVSSFLSLQARASDDPAFERAVEEARRRIAAVSLVHRRLYRSDQIEAIDAARYVDELLDDLIGSLGTEWKPFTIRDLQPVMVPTDRVVSLGLILTELVINANKYAYGGAAGPLRIELLEERANFRLIVADKGVGRGSGREGFGSTMMDALVRQLSGSIEYESNNPGTRAVLAAPIQVSSTR